jgi:hypothetical protein
VASLKDRDHRELIGRNKLSICFREQRLLKQIVTGWIVCGPTLDWKPSQLVPCDLSNAAGMRYWRAVATKLDELFHTGDLQALKTGES